MILCGMWMTSTSIENESSSEKASIEEKSVFVSEKEHFQIEKDYSYHPSDCIAVKGFLVALAT